MSADVNARPDFDAELQAIADYVANQPVPSELAVETARWCLMDALGCAFQALSYPACTKLLGPLVAGTVVPQGVRVPGTDFVLDPVAGAFNIGALIRWLDFNDTWLAAEWGHPSDNLGAILAVADFVSQRHPGKVSMQEVLSAMIQAYEIQGVLALQNSFNRVGLDHVLLVKLASAAVSAKLLGFSETELVKTLSQVFVDGQSLRTYRHAPNTGSRKSWAAGDAGARAVWLCLMTQRGENGYPSALSAKRWGFQDVTFGKALQRIQAYGSYVMENILFKVSYPAEFHAQTAVEAAIALHPQVVKRLDEIDKIVLETQESALRIISKTGPLHNPADRDHCLQYMVAVGLLMGELQAQHYEDSFAADPRLDQLRAKMVVKESRQFTEDYLAADKRSIGNSVQVFFKDGSMTEKVVVEYPVGHRRRREEAQPLLVEKFKRSAVKVLGSARGEKLLALLRDGEALAKMEVAEFMGMLKR